MGGEFGLKSKGRALASINESKEGVVGNTKVVFKVGDRVRIAIEAIKPLKQREVALQSNIDRIKWTKEIYEVRHVSIPKNDIDAILLPLMANTTIYWQSEWVGQTAGKY